MLPEHVARLSCYEARNEERDESRHGQVIPMDNGEDTDHLPLFQLGEVFLEYRPPFRLNSGLLLGRVLGRELIDGWDVV